MQYQCRDEQAKLGLSHNIKIENQFIEKDKQKQQQQQHFQIIYSFIAALDDWHKQRVEVILAPTGWFRVQGENLFISSLSFPDSNELL